MLNFTVIILIMIILLSIFPDTLQPMGSWNIQLGKEKKRKKEANLKQQFTE